MRNAESIKIALDHKTNYKLNPPPTDVTDRCRSSPKRVLLHKLREVVKNVHEILEAHEEGHGDKVVVVDVGRKI